MWSALVKCLSLVVPDLVCQERALTTWALRQPGIAAAVREHGAQIKVVAHRRGQAVRWVLVVTVPTLARPVELPVAGSTRLAVARSIAAWARSVEA